MSKVCMLSNRKTKTTSKRSRTSRTSWMRGNRCWKTYGLTDYKDVRRKCMSGKECCRSESYYWQRVKLSTTGWSSVGLLSKRGRLNWLRGISQIWEGKLGTRINGLSSYNWLIMSVITTWANSTTHKLWRRLASI